MPYGITRRTTAASYRARRTTAATKLQRAARKSAVAKKRAKPTVRANRYMARANAKAINQLKVAQWGSWQTTSSSWSAKMNVTDAHPLCFHVNNPHSGAQGPYVWRPNLLGDITQTSTQFIQWNGADTDSHLARSANFVPNGPKLMLRSMDFQFKFHGFVNNTRIRVDFVRQKHMPRNIFNPNNPTRENFLPQTLKNFRWLAGFSQNYIDRTTYQVLATKYVYMNSKGDANPTDTAQDRLTTEPSTPSTKYCHVHLKLNKILRQLEPSLNEETGHDYPAHEGEDMDRSHGSSYAYDNQYPTSNIFCIISSDDGQGFLDALTGDAVGVEVIRKCTWQDHRG